MGSVAISTKVAEEVAKSSHRCLRPSHPHLHHLVKWMPHDCDSVVADAGELQIGAPQQSIVRRRPLQMVIMCRSSFAGEVYCGTAEST